MSRNLSGELITTTELERLAKTRRREDTNNLLLFLCVLGAFAPKVGALGEINSHHGHLFQTAVRFHGINA